MLIPSQDNHMSISVIFFDKNSKAIKMVIEGTKSLQWTNRPDAFERKVRVW